MTKPALMRPRAFELFIGMMAVVLLAGVVISRSGPQSSSAGQMVGEVTPTVRSLAPREASEVAKAESRDRQPSEPAMEATARAPSLD